MRENYDIIVTKGSKRLCGLYGTVRNPTTSGVEADLENGERVSLKNPDYDYLSEFPFAVNPGDSPDRRHE